MLYQDPPVTPAVDVFRSSAPGTHGWANVPCLAGARAIDARTALAELPLAVDIESYGLNQYSSRLKCVGFASERGAVVLDPRDPRGYDAIRFLIDNAAELIFHNSAFDVPNLARNGLLLPSHCHKVTDTLIWARLAEPDNRVRKSLGATGNRYLGTPLADHLLKAFKVAGLTKEQGYYQFDLDRYVYLIGAAADAIMTWNIRPHVRRAALARLTTGHPFTENGVTGADAEELVDREQRLNRVLLRRACKGLRVDLGFLDEYRDLTAVKLDKADAALRAEGVRPGNAGDLIKFLEKHDAIPEGYPRTEKTKRPSTVADHLETLGHPVAKTFVIHKQITKVGDDYLAKVADQAGQDGRIYPVTNILGAATGRASVADPPLHQFPEDARGIVLADEGDRLTSTDWSQIEPVIIANIAGDHEVILAYESGKVDFYEGVSQAASLARPTAKVVLLAQLYGEGLKKLAADLGVSIEKAEELRSLIFGTLPHTAKLVQPASAGPEGRLRRIARDFRVVFTLSGRIIPIPMGRPFEREDGTLAPPTPAAHKGVNYFVQGSAYDVLAETVLRGEDEGLGDTLYLTMHDEVVTSEDAAEEWGRIMQTPPERLVRLAKRVPLLRTDRADMGERWAKV